MSFSALDFIRKPGDMVQSEDWNKTMSEIERLGNDKANTVNGSLTGKLSIDEKLLVGSFDNNLLIDSTVEGELSMRTGRKSDQLILGNDEGRALTISQNKVGVGTSKPEEMLEVNGHLKAKPIMAQWYPTVHGPHNAAGHHYIKWDKEEYNSAPYYFEKSSGNEKIKILKPGYYKVSAKALVYLHWGGSYSHMYLRKNCVAADHGFHLDMDHGGYYYPRGNTDFWHVRRVEGTGYFNAGDTISATIYRNTAVGHLYHLDPWYTRLDISKLN